jgi:pimeloyl-ACP methyl ester carboxylesterase
VTESLLTRDSVLVDGCRVSYRVGGSGPTLILIHGGSAHGGWWTGVSALLAPRFRVVVPDLSGHGQSGHREAYGPSVWARDVEEVLNASGAAKAFVVGHSMGGAVGVYFAASRFNAVKGLVLVDTDLLPSAEARPELSPRTPANPVYETREEILDRFRLLPPGVHEDPRVLRDLAEESITRAANGWTWRYDPRTRQRVAREDLRQQLSLVRCQVGYVAGELSPISDDRTVQYLQQQLGREVLCWTIPDASHHVPLDSPGECAAAVEDFVRQSLRAESEA